MTHPMLMNTKANMRDPVNSWKGKKILIVEDDYVNYLYLHEILSGVDTCLIRAVTLQEAFDMITAAIGIDLIIINTGMPGNESCRSVRRMKMLWPAIRIIAITGTACNTKNNHCHPSGCDALISYRLEGEDMLFVVGELMRDS